MGNHIEVDPYQNCGTGGPLKRSNVAAHVRLKIFSGSSCSETGRTRFDVVIDDNQDGRFFLSKTLLETFPRADIIECENSETALRELQSGKTAVFLLHRATDAKSVA
jgi:hypothetical protein